MNCMHCDYPIRQLNEEEAHEYREAMVNFIHVYDDNPSGYFFCQGQMGVAAEHMVMADAELHQQVMV